MPSQERHSPIVHTTYTCPLHTHTFWTHLPHFRGIPEIGNNAPLHKSMMRLMNRLETWQLQQYPRLRLMCRSQIYADVIVVHSWMPLHAWMYPERTSWGVNSAHRHRPLHLSWPALNICFVPYLLLYWKISLCELHNHYLNNDDNNHTMYLLYYLPTSNPCIKAQKPVPMRMAGVMAEIWLPWEEIRDEP